MSVIETAVGIMESWAADPSHGYDQQYRWGERGDFDCSSAVISAWDMAGVPVKAEGATYTGNMRGAFLRCGFADVTQSIDLSTGHGLQRGDVLLNHQHHTAMFCGDGIEVEASINENGGATGGQPGDQTGREFLKRSYRNFPWDCVLRYIGPVEDGEEIASGLLDDEEIELPTVIYSISLPEIEYGSVGEFVRAVQALLILRKCPVGVDGADGDFGPATRRALINYQIAHGLEADGIVGRETFNSLLFNK